ncbi:MAG: hypothetical protein D6775_02945 [Caldilineae bacterium]|nr:MAG: hypothetical protein D6775_02945 [Caldilineae bacterium]
MERRNEPVDPRLIQPILRTGAGYYLLAAFLSAVVAAGLYVWIRQLRLGLAVTGMNHPVYWGLYITNFVFFIGISHAGTLISAILRVTGAEWRRPITRAAEAITVFALIVGAAQVIIDMGRPDRILNVIAYGRFQSPLLWDVTSITVYLLGSITYLYLPLIPDMAILRDNLPADAPAWRRRLYTLLALGWHGGPEQRRRLERAVGVMAVLIIPIAVSVHTVVSWIFAMTLRPMWHSTIFGPYFVIGAIYSGIATILIAMAVIRKVFHLEAYLKPLHFRYLGMLLITFNALWFYFTFAEYLTTGYGGVPHEMRVFNAKLSGEYQAAFWAMVFSMAVAFVILLLPHLPAPRRVRLPAFRPGYALATAGTALAVALVMVSQNVSGATQAGLAPSPALTRLLTWLLVVLLLGFGVSVLPVLRRNIVVGTVIAAFLVDLGMWLERFTIVVPTETRPMLEGYTIGIYHPTATEWILTAASFAGFALLYVIFVKLFPIISIWEVQEAEEVIPQMVEKVKGYLPGV